MKLKNVLPISLSMFSVYAVGGIAMADSYPVHLEKSLESVCRNAAQDDHMGLRRAVKQLTPTARVTTSAYKAVANGLVCNGMDLVNFASYYGAVDTYRILRRHVDQRTVVEIKDMQVSRVVPQKISVSFSAGR